MMSGGFLFLLSGYGQIISHAQRMNRREYLL